MPTLDKREEISSTDHHHVRQDFCSPTVPFPQILAPNIHLSTLPNYGSGHGLPARRAWICRGIFVKQPQGGLACRYWGCKPHVCSLRERLKHVTELWFCTCRDRWRLKNKKSRDFYFYFIFFTFINEIFLLLTLYR